MGFKKLPASLGESHVNLLEETAEYVAPFPATRYSKER